MPEFSVMFWHIIAQSPPGDKGAWPSIQILTRGRNHFWLAGVGEWISVLLPNENWALALPIEGGPAGLANRVQCQARRFLRPRQKVILPFHSAFRQCLQTSLRLWVLMASGLESKLDSELEQQMNVLITGICGFVGSALTRALLESSPHLRLFGVDNFIRPGSELNRAELARLGVKIFHGDLRNATDLETLPKADWVIDAAANPSVLAGVDGKTSSRQLLEHNLWATVNALEYCKKHRAGLILLSTSRVYSVKLLAELAVDACNQAFVPRMNSCAPGLTVEGVAETFSTEPPLSLYGSSKLASEVLALEYAEAFQFPVWINRCGVLAGAGQFGKPDQGIFSFWINAHLRKRPLKYIGFSGTGHQVRDCLHPRDVAGMILKQMNAANDGAKTRIQNLSGGAQNSMSLAQLTDWCNARFGKHAVQSDLTPRPFDIPWMVLDSALAQQQWNWQPTFSLEKILGEIADHAEKHPNWLEISQA